MSDEQNQPENEIEAAHPRKNPIRLGVDALKGLSLSVPARVQAILDSDELPVLKPGPCQSEHSLAAALDSMVGSPVREPARFDPTFDDIRGSH